MSDLSTLKHLAVELAGWKIEGILITPPDQLPYLVVRAEGKARPARRVYEQKGWFYWPDAERISSSADVLNAAYVIAQEMGCAWTEAEMGRRVQLLAAAMAARFPDERVTALKKLASELDARSLSSLLLTPTGRHPYLLVYRPTLPHLARSVHAQDGWFFWREDDLPIAACEEPAAAADTISLVLSIPGETGTSKLDDA